MQIVPETGRLMGTHNLFNPTENIAAGTKYLRYLFDRFGDQRMVLAAYNAGEGNVERFGGVPPFPETQNYLQRVSARTQQYRQGIRGTYVASSPPFSRRAGMSVQMIGRRRSPASSIGRPNPSFADGSTSASASP